QLSVIDPPTSGTLASHSGAVGGPASNQRCVAALSSVTLSPSLRPTIPKGSSTASTIASDSSSAASVRRPRTSLSTRPYSGHMEKERTTAQSSTVTNGQSTSRHPASRSPSSP